MVSLIKKRKRKLLGGGLIQIYDTTEGIFYDALFQKNSINMSLIEIYGTEKFFLYNVYIKENFCQG